jgi:hypothetical protein
MTNDPTPQASDSLLASGDGHAAAAGIGFQARLGSTFACQLLAERLTDRRLGLGDARIRSLRFETEAPVDDILIETDKGGWVFVQAKTRLSLSGHPDSDFGKTAEQIVRLWIACANSQSKRGWDRTLVPGKDGVLLAIGMGSAATVSANLAGALESIRASGAAPLPQYQRKALDAFVAQLKRAWHQIEGQPPSDEVLQSLLQLVTILVFDFEGADRTSAIEALANVLAKPANANSAFEVLTSRCAELMTKRFGSDAAGFRQTLLAANIGLLAAPTFAPDVARFCSYSERVQTHLSQYEETKVGGEQIKIDRPVVRSVMQAALQGSLLLVGEPGAGKSAVVSAAADGLRTSGHAACRTGDSRHAHASPLEHLGVFE